MNKAYFFCVLLGWFGSMRSQAGGKTDPLVAVVQGQLRVTRHDTARVTLMLRLSRLYLKQGHADSTYNLLRQGLVLAKRSKFPLYLGRVYNGFGNYYRHRKIPVQSLRAYGQAFHFLRQTNEIPEIAETMYNVARSHTEQTDQGKAIEHIEQSISYARQTGYNHWVGPLYDLLFAIHRRIDDQKSALDDLKGMKKALDDHPCLSDEYLYHTMAGYWYAKKDFPKAMLHFKKALQAARQLKSSLDIVETCAMMVCHYVEEKSFDEAEYYLKIGLEEAKKYEVPSSYIYIASSILRQEQGRLPEAEADALTSLRTAQKNSSLYGTEPVLAIVAQIQEKRGKYRQALATLKELGVLRDSINRLEQIKAIKAVEAGFSLQKKEKDLKLMRQEAFIQKQAIKRAHQQQNLYFGLAAGLGSLLFLMAWIVRRDRRNLRLLGEQKAEITAQAMRLNELNEVKDKLFSLIGHDLRAPVIHLKLLVDGIAEKSTSLQWPRQQNDQLQRTVDSLYYTVDNLLHWASTQKEGMILQRGAASLSDAIVESLDLFEAMIRQKNIWVEVDVPQQDMVCVDESQLQVVIRNILHNAIKFTPIGGSIRISLDDLPTTEKVLLIADTGSGMNPKNVVQTAGTAGEKGTGLGLLVCREFMTRNGGRMEIGSSHGHGTTVQLIFPTVEPKTLTPSCSKTGYSY